MVNFNIIDCVTLFCPFWHPPGFQCKVQIRVIGAGIFTTTGREMLCALLGLRPINKVESGYCDCWFLAKVYEAFNFWIKRISFISKTLFIKNSETMAKVVN